MIKRLAMGFLLLLLILSSITFIPLHSFLVIEPLDEDGEPAYIPIGEDETFSIRYTHSIHLSEVEEFYRLTSSDEIQQTKLLYEDTAIGMPSDAEGEEVFQRTSDGRYLITNMDRRFPFIDIRIGQVVANHRLVFRGETYPLKDYFTKGSIVRLQFKKVSLFSKWKGVVVVGKG
ncbi:DUF1850 domain-containing protein [Rossellomorea aquimaris]|uniref:DUF1850 domain-containing protein n=1 Tax=Rossellomorea aquimaris TaxID=189382 RepID=UPI001CD72A8F|nr:DUF1850 domain-containing protein [Rossellomorea aquimaris]MCA1056699.1 DUF1850 domain-containing protein [Rossellomorea aquimaris]